MKKQPYEMTLVEWKEARKAAGQAELNALKAFAGSPRQKQFLWGAPERIRLEYGASPKLKRKNSYPIIYHRDVIEKALSEGKRIPSRVLSDYPDLARRK